MSWWFGVEIDTGGDEAAGLADRDMTYNLAPMLYEALGHPFGDLHGAPCSEAGGPILAAVGRMADDPDRFRAFDPPNGWGDYDIAIDNLRWLAQQCASHPRARIYVH